MLFIIKKTIKQTNSKKLGLRFFFLLILRE